MIFNSVTGVCDRRVILNWRVDPKLIAKQLPHPFRPRLVNGKAIVGIDVLKLFDMRPTGFPSFAGFATENAVDRISVEWEEGGSTVQGLFVPNRYSPSAVNALVSIARLFPTVFKHATFDFEERNGKFRISLIMGGNRLEMEAKESDQLEAKSVFKTAQSASDFHRDSKISYSPSHDSDIFDAVYLKTLDWNATPLKVHSLSYTFIERAYPGAEFDSALIMKSTRHEWHGLGAINTKNTFATDKRTSLEPAKKDKHRDHAKTASRKGPPPAGSRRRDQAEKDEEQQMGSSSDRTRQTRTSARAAVKVDPKTKMGKLGAKTKNDAKKDKSKAGNGTVSSRKPSGKKAAKKTREKRA
jgi:Uncharacterized conserved protein (COG2071).